jgi:hypothetical protein
VGEVVQGLGHQSSSNGEEMAARSGEGAAPSPEQSLGASEALVELVLSVGRARDDGTG